MRNKFFIKNQNCKSQNKFPGLLELIEKIFCVFVIVKYRKHYRVLKEFIINCELNSISVPFLLKLPKKGITE